MIQLLVIAKQPIPGRVKTRLCPPCTPEQAAEVADASLTDTLRTVAQTPARRRVLVLDGAAPRPDGFAVVPQRGDGLAARLTHGFQDTALPDMPSLLIGMDTPQVTSTHLTGATDLLTTADAVLGMAHDGGWWALGLRRPEHAELLRTVPMSTPDTGRLTAEALRREGLSIAALPVLRDVDNARDARVVAAECPDGDFARTVARLVPETAP
ncbi:MAG TPA: TIGR04282 family arsenosugar biosynthesis glycosyltransferase [Micromonosporaceae bacterium]|nr:TIGR04282 family arsenosugar biosynthesis glycosyltransferase [Micromonosporaceae bacterium]